MNRILSLPKALTRMLLRVSSRPRFARHSRHVQDPRSAIALLLSFAVALPLTLLQCSGVAPNTQSAGEHSSGYTYIPLDAYPVEMQRGFGCTPTYGERPKVWGKLLQSLPDNSVRMLVQQEIANGKVTYGPAKLGTQNEFYRVTVDYVNADAISVPLWLWRIGLKAGETEYVSFAGAADPKITGVTWQVSRDKPFNEDYPDLIRQFNIPVYVGVGLRVIANVQVIGATANISGLGVLGAEAEASNLRGSLVVQTLGINGKSIAAALPIQSELNRTTAQNAVVAVASIKTLLYADDTEVAPRVVGLYLPFAGDADLVNGIVTALYAKPLVWERPCLAEPTVTAGAPSPTATTTLTPAAARDRAPTTPTPSATTTRLVTATPSAAPSPTPTGTERPTPFAPTQPPPRRSK